MADRQVRSRFWETKVPRWVVHVAEVLVGVVAGVFLTWIYQSEGPAGLTTAIIATAAAVSALTSLVAARSSAASVELLNIEKRRLRAGAIELAERMREPLNGLAADLAVLDHLDASEGGDHIALAVLVDVNSMLALFRELLPLIRVADPHLTIAIVAADETCSNVLAHKDEYGRVDLERLRILGGSMLARLESVEHGALAFGWPEDVAKMKWESRARMRTNVIADRLDSFSIRP